MSYGDCGYAFTDDEIEAGVPALMCGYDDYDDDYEARREADEVKREWKLDWYHGQKLELKKYYKSGGKKNEPYENYLKRGFKRRSETYEEYLELNKKTEAEIVKKEARAKEEAEKRECELKADITNVIAGFNNNTQIQEKAIRKLFSINIEYMIGVYSKMELLTYDYIYIAKQKNCINILIKNFLKKNKGYILTSEIVDNIDLFTKKIYANYNKDIVYNRVYQIQQFIHIKIDEKYGEDAHLKLHAKTMKDILSTARLHLNLEDIKHENIKSLINIIKQSEQASINEAKHPMKVILAEVGISYINRKRIRDMKSLINFGYFDIESKIFDIANLNKNKSVDEFKEEVIQIYSDITKRRFIKRHRRWGISADNDSPNEVSTHSDCKQVNSEVNKKVQMNFKSIKFGGMLIDINNFSKLEVIHGNLYLITKHSEKILVGEYEIELEANEDKIIYENVFENPAAAVILITDEGLLKIYGDNSDEYRELHMGFCYEEN